MNGAVEKARQLRSRPVVVLTYSAYAPRAKPTPPSHLRRSGYGGREWFRKLDGPAALLDSLFEQPLLPTFEVIRQWSQV